MNRIPGYILLWTQRIESKPFYRYLVPKERHDTSREDERNENDAKELGEGVARQSKKVGGESFNPYASLPGTVQEMRF